MIRHVVLWELHDPADAAAFCEALDTCRALVPGQRGWELARRGGTLPASVDVCLIASFDDAAALEAYQHHPVHQAVSAGLTPLRRARHVIDFEVDGGRAG